MSTPAASDAAPAPQPSSSQPTVVIHHAPSPLKGWLLRILLIGLLLSVLFNIGMFSKYREYYAETTPPNEKFYKGDKLATDKLAAIEITGTIMPPYTGRILKSIQRAGDDDRVKGVLLIVNSPGGLVADSHQIYHALRKVSVDKKKPVYVSMKSMAASGGYYVAMGAGPEGRVYAEPTTWTGSIGVIIPRFDLSGLAKEWRIESDPLKTGEFKDALSPFRELTEAERAVWNEILDDAFQRFVSVIDDNRPNLDRDQVLALATGQVYTALQAKKNGLVDEIAFEDEIIEEMKQKLQLDKVRVVKYDHPAGLLEVLAGKSEAPTPEETMTRLLDAAVPRAMYHMSAGPVFARWHND